MAVSVSPTDDLVHTDKSASPGGWSPGAEAWLVSRLHCTIGQATEHAFWPVSRGFVKALASSPVFTAMIAAKEPIMYLYTVFAGALFLFKPSRALHT